MTSRVCNYVTILYVERESKLNFLLLRLDLQLHNQHNDTKAVCFMVYCIV